MITVRIVIFAKVPQAGLVKTRLIPALGADGAAGLARRMLEHTITQAINADVGVVELCMLPSSNDAAWRDVSIPAEIVRSDQGGGDLGMKLSRVAERVISAGESVILMGTDCPALDANSLRQMSKALNETDVAMVSTADGGYAALGLNRYSSMLFSGIEWGMDSVAHQTLLRTGRLGWTVRMLPMLHDIDETVDLKWLPTNWPEADYGPV